MKIYSVRIIINAITQYRFTFDDAIALTMKMIALSVSHYKTKFERDQRKISNNLFLMTMHDVIRERQL